LEDPGGGVAGGPASQAGFLRMGWEQYHRVNRKGLQQPLDGRFCWLQTVCVLAQGLTSAPLPHMSMQSRGADRKALGCCQA